MRNPLRTKKQSDADLPRVEIAEDPGKRTRVPLVRHEHPEDGQEPQPVELGHVPALGRGLANRRLALVGRAEHGRRL